MPAELVLRQLTFSIVFLFTDIHIHVTNDNEFNPEFSQTSYTVYVELNTLIGTSVLTVSADDLDADLDTDNEFCYSLDQTALGDDYFHVDQKGRVYLVKNFLEGQDRTSFTAVVTNPCSGASVRTGNATIILAAIPGSTTTQASTTTDRNKGKGRWVTCNFRSFLTAFQSYQADGNVIIKGCVNSVYKTKV